MAEPRALLFDVFGTCVDWRSGVIREGEALGAAWGSTASTGPAWPTRGAAATSRSWRRSAAARGRGWTSTCCTGRRSTSCCRGSGWPACAEPERQELTLAWHRLDGWPDTVEGLTRLKRRFVIAPCSNGHIALVVAMARHAGLPWDAVLGAEIARAYKPQPAVYEASARALGLEPREAMMVAAHPGDLEAAAACGLRTAYVHRPEEYGSGTSPEPPPGDGDVDLRAGDLVELARLLGA